MKRRLLVVAIALAAVVLLLLVGFSILSGDEIDDRELPKIENADVIYDNAQAAVSAAQDAVLSISKTLETALADDYYLETTQQTLAYTGKGTNSMRASIAETLDFNGHKVSICEFFANEIGYVTVEDSHFFSQISAQEYCKRFPPAVLLDAQLYENIAGFDTGDGYLVRFQRPTAAESWALDEYSEFIEAMGTAYISYDGMLTRSVYSILYTSGNAVCLLTVTADAELTTPSIAFPADTSVYTPIAYLDGPRMLERASGYLLQADNIRSIYNDSIYFQAFGDERTEAKTLHTLHDGSWSAKVDSDVTLANDSRVGQAAVFTQSELFTQGIYFVSADGTEPTPDPEITESAMRTYCQDLLLGTIMLPRYINGAELSETESTLRVTFTANDAFVQQIASTACQTLYQEPEMLNELAQKSTTDALQCYLELDKNTGLPVASGISYNGTYTIEGLPYQLLFQADQTYTILKQPIDSETAGA